VYQVRPSDSSKAGRKEYIGKVLTPLHPLLTSKKWNKKLFREMTLAFKAGRLAKDPKSFWYKGELGFFDNYIVSTDL
jgi:hypothetical protein